MSNGSGKRRGRLRVSSAFGHAADAALGLTLLASVFLRGGVTPAGWGTVAIGGSVAVGLALVAHGPAALPRGVAWLLGLTAVAVLLPLVPLPRAAVVAACPACVFTDGLPPVAGELSALRRLHTAPDRGAFEALRWVAVAAFAIAAALRARSRTAVKRFGPLVALVAGVAAALAGIGTLLGRRLTWIGADAPPTNSLLLGPLVNANHLATLFGLGLVFAVGETTGAWVRPRDRALWMLLALALGAAVLLTGSRGGILALLAPTIVSLSWRARVYRDQWKPSLAIGALAATLLCIAAVWAATGEPANELLDDSRWDLWPAGVRAMADHGLAGVGPGGSVDVVTRYLGGVANSRFAWLENSWLQLVVDSGPLLGGLLVIAVLGVWGHALRHAAQGNVASPVAALSYLAVHEFFDFATHTASVALTGVLALSAALPPARRQARGTVALALAATAGLLASVVVWRARDQLLESTLLETIERGDPADVEGIERAVLRGYPGSYPAAMAVARLNARAEDWGRALQWVGRSQRLAPQHLLPHLNAGDILLSMGLPSQAVGEYRRALELDPRAVIPVLRRLDQVPDRLKALERLALGNSPEDEARLLWAAWSQGWSESEARARTLGDQLGAGPWGRLVRLRVATADHDEAAARDLARLPATSDPSGQQRFDEGYLLARVGAHDLAWPILEAEANGPDGLRAGYAAMELALIRIREGRDEEARPWLRRMRVDSQALQARSWLELGRLEQRAGRQSAAERACRRALQVDPQYVGALLALVEGQVAVGDLAAAAASLAERPKLAADPRLREVRRLLQGSGMLVGDVDHPLQRPPGAETGASGPESARP